MGNKEWVMPTHIIAGAGVVINGSSHGKNTQSVLGVSRWTS